MLKGASSDGGEKIPVFNLSSSNATAAAAPMYVCEEVSEYFCKMIVEPIKHPEIFNDFVPVRRTSIVYGRKGVGKEKMISQLCELNNVQYVVHKIVPDLVDACYNDLVKINKERVVFISDPVVIIVSNGELLFTGAKEMDTIKSCTNLSSMVRGTNNFLIVLSNVPPIPQGGATLFFEQFDTRCFVPAPGPEFRTLFLTHLIEKQMKFISSVNSINVTVDLKKEDYKWLSLMSSNCTLKQIKDWVCKLFYKYQHANCDPVVINRVLLEDENNKLLTRATGSLSIIPVDCDQEERQFFQFSGKGIQVAHETIGQNNGVPIKTRVSAFQAKNTESNAAWSELEKKRVSKKQKV